jgi:hypothetical protein
MSVSGQHLMLGIRAAQNAVEAGQNRNEQN